MVPRTKEELRTLVSETTIEMYEEMTPQLIKLIEEEVLTHSNTLLSLNIPLSDGKAISLIDGNSVIEARLYSNDYVYYKAYVPNNLINLIKNYII